ncbi:MAG: sensor histidine kinase [Bacteroidota bacterium]
MRRSYKERNRALGAKIKEEEAIQQQTRLEQKVDTLIKENEISSLNSLLQGQEKERERIGRELHDGVVATLSTVKLYINGVNDQMNLVAKETNSKIMAANQLIDSALEEVRSISHNLSKGMLAKLGLRDALQNFGDTIQNAGQAEIDIKVHDMDERYYVETELMIYRNIQELVGNAIKHGGAKKIEVGITRHDDIINVTVQDDGGGFDYEEIKSRREGGIGLFNMERAVTTLGGTFHVDSSQGVGTTIIMDIPIKNQKESAQS